MTKPDAVVADDLTTIDTEIRRLSDELTGLEAEAHRAAKASDIAALLRLANRRDVLPLELLSARRRRLAVLIAEETAGLEAATVTLKAAEAASREAQARRLAVEKEALMALKASGAARNRMWAFKGRLANLTRDDERLADELAALAAPRGTRRLAA